MIAYQHPITPREIARVLFRHRRRIVAFFATVTALTLLAIAIYPRSYSSESKLFLRVGRESVTLDPTATTGQTIMLQKTQVDEVNAALQLLLSRDVLRQVVHEIGAERILEDLPRTHGVAGSPGPPAWIENLRHAKSWVSGELSGILAAMRLSDPGTPEEMAIRKLNSGVKVFAPKESTVITVSYSAASPQLAHDIVEALTSFFLEDHVRVNRSEGSLSFFADQTAKLRAELSAAQSELRDTKNEFQISTIDSRRAVFAKQLEDVELQKLATGRELAYIDAEIADLTRSIGSLQPELVTNRINGFANEAKDLMRQKLYELEIEESKLRSRYSENHPLLEQIQRQRKEAAEILTDLPDDRTQTTAALNPNQRALELDLLQAQAKKKALEARATAAQKQLDSLSKELQALNDHEVQLVELERNVQILDGKYRMHVDKLEQARVNDALGREQISNIKVALPATLVGKPTSPKKALLLGFGLMVATCGALALAFVTEVFDQTLRTVEQVESELGLPVLLSFPKCKRAQLVQEASAAGAERNGKANGANAPTDGCYRALARTMLQRDAEPNGRLHGKAVGVIGCETTKARSRVAADLAIQAANCSPAPVLLIDADERHRRVTQRFGLNGSPGWREVVFGAAEIGKCVHASSRVNLAVMTPGEESGQAVNGNVRIDRARLDALKTEYGLVVIDMPPVDEFDAPPTADWLDETVLVIEAERTHIQAALRAKTKLERSGVRVTGIVLANEREHVPRWLNDRL
jgi:uncharacterized protein involved in exopolysaccharide biosynthesis/Mrp family chromosome partitioning ATPase